MEDNEYNELTVKIMNIKMLKIRTLFCDRGVSAIPHVIQNVLIPFEKWKTAPKIPNT